MHVSLECKKFSCYFTEKWLHHLRFPINLKISEHSQGTFALGSQILEPNLIIATFRMFYIQICVIQYRSVPTPNPYDYVRFSVRLRFIYVNCCGLAKYTSSPR